MKKFIKKTIAVIMAMVMVVAAAQSLATTKYSPAITQSLATTQALAATEFPARDGYTLVPTMFGTSGVDTLSSFTLRTPRDYASSPQVLIDGQDAPMVTRTNNRTFTVTPVIALTHNSVYVFRLQRENEIDITWAFQTAKRFEITTTLPRNEATNVPVRTGIEISFSYGDAPDISEHFNIYPHAEGRFISRDSTAIFMPTSPLAHGTVYTVSIRAGVGLEGTSEVIGTERVFLFETEPAPDRQERRRWPSSVSFSSVYVEFPSFAAPEVNYWLNYDRHREKRPAIDFILYRIDDRAEVISAVTRFSGRHRWSRFSGENEPIDVSGLTFVFSNTITEWQGGINNWNETFTFPVNLPPGFYVLDAKTNEPDSGSRQVIIQITDLAVQVVGDEEQTLLWINDMNTGYPAALASVYDPVTQNNFAASEHGIATVERMLSNGEYLIVGTEGFESVVFVHSAQQFWRGGWYDDYWYGGHWGGGQSGSNQYWTALQLDRTLFQRNDTLHLWGFVQNRRENENINFVTAVLTEGSHWWGRSSSGRETLHRENISVRNGAYSGEILLPHLDPGHYEIAIYHGDVLLNSTFFSVQDYTKPPYQLTVSGSHAAIFSGEEVTFTARTEFFEGTPVPDLSLSYSFHGHELTTAPRGQATTNIDGVVEVSASPKAANASVQGERSMMFTSEATLPEIGWVHEMSSVRVFVNDIDVRPHASRSGVNATLSVDVHDITLDRLNDGTHEHWGDYLGEPRRGQEIQVAIVEIYWEAIRDGEFYCHVTRQVVPRHRYERRENVLERFELRTDTDGAATKNFTVPDRKHRSYQARMNTTDGNGRTISHDVFIGHDFTRFFEEANNNRLFLDGANEEGYDIGDEVELTIMRGAEKVEQGNFLFVVVQDGIMSYHVGTNPLKFTFGEQHIPNARVFAYHFNGHTFNAGEGGSWMMSQHLRFNPKNRELIINIKADREAYRPGETPTFTITATDADGNPKAANINISLVDEALFSLMDYTVDTLEMLYRNISDNLRVDFATHRAFDSDGIDDFSYGFMELSEDSDDGGARRQAGGILNAMPAPAMATSEMMWGAPGSEEAETRIRERFEDTAIFTSVRTNAQGMATLDFPLPDNITSWRVTASGISNDLYAGNSVQNVRVSLPMFLHYTLNKTFLAGDIPTIGVNAFGTSLSGGERVEFSVWREDAPNDIRTATGASFERVNIPLWEKTEEGFGAIVIRANVLNFSDAVKHEYQVVNSHRLIDTAVFHEVTPQTEFSVNQTGLTNITFANYGRGQFLNELLRLRHTWFSGARIEGLVARREAIALIREHFPDVKIFGESDNFDITNYQTQNGGIAILPYSNEELEVTVKLLPFIKDEINLPALRNYLYDVFEKSATDNKMLALYGLAQLGEPILFDLQNYAKLEDLSVRNIAYVSLGFAALGDIQTAREIYDSRIASLITTIVEGRLYRVNAGATQAEIWDATSVVALLAAQLGKPEALGLHNYATSERHAVIWRDGRPSSVQLNAAMLLNLEHLNFITREIENHSAEPASITYKLFGETVNRDLGYNKQFTLRIPAQNMHEFELTSVTGQVGAVSIVRTPLEYTTPTENNVTVRRGFFRAGSNTASTTFAQDELVRVQITVEYSATDLSGTYVITDFLPAGLAHVAHSARFGESGNNPGRRAWVTTEGQRVTFFDHSGGSNRIRVYHYYARVINPGTFTAEGTIVQSLGAREYMTVGENAAITLQ
ncbi:MAG: Ig-like domain-containing protein [Defluviitaleaceae bacterium]|nr:Ig-like domain-containing protein [Defluviitaleaceae bacterium]